MNHELHNIPYLGLGIGLRREIMTETLAHKDEIDVLEIIAEKFFPSKNPLPHQFEKFFEQFPIIPHGVDLSIGSVVPLEDEFRKDMRDLSRLVNASYYSDHFALTRSGPNLGIGHLSPLWYTKEMLEHIVRKVDDLQQYLGIPLVLENITAPFDLGEADFEEPEFIAEVHERTGCGLLLDVTNIHINAYNRGTNALEFLKRYPMDAVVQVHLAGGEVHHDFFDDTHSQEIEGPNEGIWELLEWTARNASIKVLIIERDNNFKEDFETMILRDLRRARAIVEGARNGAASSRRARTPERNHRRTGPTVPIA